VLLAFDHLQHVGGGMLSRVSVATASGATSFSRLRSVGTFFTSVRAKVATTDDDQLLCATTVEFSMVP
jgi:hypothetical protein